MKCVVNVSEIHKLYFSTLHALMFALTDHTAGLHSVLVNLHQVVSQIAELWLHTLRKRNKRREGKEKEKRTRDSG